MINVEVFPASYGESILVNLGTNDVKNILIDCGFASTYNNHIKKRLLELFHNGQKIDLLVLTHFDADHIRGAINLLQENGGYADSRIIEIKDIWINMLKHMEIATDKVEFSEEYKKKLKTVLRKRYPQELFCRYINDISSSQSLTLSELISSGKYNVNDSFAGGLVRVNEQNNTVSLSDDIKITILSPTVEKIDRLNGVWTKELLKLGLQPKFNNCEELDEAFEKVLVNLVQGNKRGFLRNCSNEKDIINVLSENDEFIEDTDEVNGSSIAFILEYNKKKILFLGDSHPSVIETEIKKYINGKEERLNIDLVKVAHHGSSGNISKELLKIIDCDKFLICTNGAQYSHPDPESIARIITSNPGKQKEIIMNYETPSIKQFFNEDMMKKYRYSIRCTNKMQLDNKKCKSTYIKI